MAVFDRGYRGYRGARLTPLVIRPLVLTRYALRDVFASRIFLIFFCACFLWPLACSVIIYLHYNLEALGALDLQILDLIKIDERFFNSFYLSSQGSAAFLMALVVGPALISPDQRNNAMPLLLSRPLGRIDYVFGKWLVLVLLLSAITWVPGILLFLFQAYLAGGGWLLEHGRIAAALFLGSWAWILVLSLFSLAVSAWVKWKPWARVLFLGGFFVTTAMGEMFQALYGTWHGALLNPFEVIAVVWDQLFGTASDALLPSSVAWLALVLFWSACAMLLVRRVRAYEVSS